MSYLNYTIDGNSVCATSPGFKCLATCPAGFGNSLEDAFNNFFKGNNEKIPFEKLSRWEQDFVHNKQREVRAPKSNQQRKEGLCKCIYNCKDEGLGTYVNFRVAILPPYSPKRWRRIGYVCSTCHDKLTAIDPWKLDKLIKSVVLQMTQEAQSNIEFGDHPKSETYEAGYLLALSDIKNLTLCLYTEDLEDTLAKIE